MTHRIAVLAGDGVGPEVVHEARRCVDDLKLEIEWSELDRDVRFDYFNIAAVTKRIARLKRDPWAKMDAAARPLDDAMMAKVGYRRK